MRERKSERERGGRERERENGLFFIEDGPELSLSLSSPSTQEKNFHVFSSSLRHLTHKDEAPPAQHQARAKKNFVYYPTPPNLLLQVLLPLSLSLSTFSLNFFPLLLFLPSREES